jgi:thymidine kinase
MAPCLQAYQLNDIWTNSGYQNSGNMKDLWAYNAVKDSDVILINEGQFFSDLYDVVLDMLSHNKKVYICGLDGDFERKKFGQILDLIPLCDKVTKLTSLCSQCKDGTPGIFSMRLTTETQQTLVGSDNYIPVCRKCYEQNKK